MRYLVAMVLAVLSALAATLFVSGPVASAVVARMSFENPDQVAMTHSLAFMLVNVAALALGWWIGWTVAGRRGRRGPAGS
jgi:hypothetical protein